MSVRKGAPRALGPQKIIVIIALTHPPALLHNEISRSSSWQEPPDCLHLHVRFTRLVGLLPLESLPQGPSKWVRAELTGRSKRYFEPTWRRAPRATL